jgi:hypothetical protein
MTKERPRGHIVRVVASEMGIDVESCQTLFDRDPCHRLADGLYRPRDVHMYVLALVVEQSESSADRRVSTGANPSRLDLSI